jgi:hypothetical protein
VNIHELPDGTLENACEVDARMIWATTVEDGRIRLYINETDTLTFDRESAEAVVKALKGVLSAGV